MIVDSSNEINFPYDLSLTDTQVSKFCKAVANNSSANIKSSKTQLSKMVHPGDFLIFLIK